jgi:hypothetical protein
MQPSALLRQQLQDAVAELSPAARAVFEDMTALHDDREPEPSGDFDGLTPTDKTSVQDATDLSNRLADAEAAEEAQRAETLEPRRRRFWIASVLYSLGCLVAVAAVLVDVYTAPTEPDPADTVVTTHEDVAGYLAAHVPPPAPGVPPAFSIPTGLYITLVEITGPYTVEIAGGLWQRYADDLPKDLTKGIFIPNAKDQPTLTEVYRERRNNEELIGWAFHTTLRETFDYSRYPMDRHQIRLRMWHPDFERNVFLTPDLSAYTSTDPAALPGVDTGLVLENRDIQQAFFSYRSYNQNANFGASTYAAQQLHPELYYSLAVRRHLVSPLIARGITPVVTLITLFMIVMVLSKDKVRREMFGVTPGSVIIVGAALLFAVLLSHNAMRDEVKAAGLLYLGYLYVITYLAILGVVFDSVLLVSRPDFKLFRDHDNLFVKLTFWPMITSAVLVVTLLMFYG